MRIVKISNYYNSFINDYYKRFPDIKNQNYLKQYFHLIKQRIGWSDFYTKAFENLGHKSFEIIFNAKYLQKAWAISQNIKEDGFKLLFCQLKYYKPDVVWFQDSFSFPAEFLKILKTKIKSIKLLVGNCCSPYSEKEIKKLQVFDIVTTCSPVFINSFKKKGLKPVLIYHAFSKQILDEVEKIERKNDIIFIGSIIPGKGFHQKRKNFLELVAKNNDFSLKFYGNLMNNNFYDVGKQRIFYILKEIIETIGLGDFFSRYSKYNKIRNLEEFPRYLKISKTLKKSYSEKIFGLNMYQELIKSKLTFDIQGEVGGNYAATMRIFEATGLGLCLLVEDKKNIKDLFEPEKEIIVFKDFNEAVEKISWLFKNEKKLYEIGKNAQKRVLKEHTYDNRAKKLLSVFAKFI